MEEIATVERAGIVGILLFILIAGARGWWVWGWLYQQAIKDRDEWKRIALRGTNVLEKVAERKIKDDDLL